MKFAREAAEIVPTIRANEKIRKWVLALMRTRPILGKATEERQRNETFRQILIDLVEGRIERWGAAAQLLESKCPQESSQYADDKHVFTHNWAQRHVQTQLSRFYNQAVLEFLISLGAEQCWVPHSRHEHEASHCTQSLAGRRHDPKELHHRLIAAYELGEWDTQVRIPDHPNCSHVISPVF